MDISVIIPSFNRAHTLARALDSVVAQHYCAREIIVVDDASTDETSSLLRQYPAVHSIRLSENRGVSAARNVGLEYATSDWIAFLDSDDEWATDKLSKQVVAAKASPEQLIFHTQEHWVRNGKRVNALHKHAKPDGWVYENSLALCCVSPSSILINRKVFDVCGDFDEDLPACEDYDLWLRMFSRYPVKLIDEPLVTKYGGHEDQLSHKHWGMDRFRVNALRKMLEHDYLNDKDRKLTKAMLQRKCTILIKGAQKRGRVDRVQFYQSVIDQIYSSQTIK